MLIKQKLIEIFLIKLRITTQFDLFNGKKIISSTDVNKVLKDDGVEAIDTVNYQNLSNIDIEDLKKNLE